MTERYNPYQGVGAGEWDVPRWADISFPAQAINPDGSTAPPAIDTGSGLLMFSGSADNIVNGVAVLPRSWKPASTIKPYVRLRFPTGAVGKNTRWKLEYDRANPGDNFFASWGLGLITHNVMTVANPVADKKHVVAIWPDLTMAGYQIGTAITWRVSRLAASDGGDDDTNDCALLSFGVFYQALRAGTLEVPA